MLDINLNILECKCKECWKHKKYIRYAVFQLVVCGLSLLPLYFVLNGLVDFGVLCFVATGVSAVNFLVTICLCARDTKDVLVRKFHLG